MLISISEALTRLNQVHPHLDVESIPLALALGRTLAESVTAPIDLPPFSRAAMDGYAVLSQDTLNAPLDLAVSGQVAAGQIMDGMPPHTAVRIFTGACLPSPADSVIEQEASAKSSQAGHVHLARPVAKGRNVMPKGHQYHRGDTVFLAGERLQASHLGTLAGLGVPRVRVYRKLRVAIVQTGNELRSSEAALDPGMIYEVQAVWLPHLISEWGGTVTEVLRVGDELGAICQALENLAEVDLIITTGGVSVGDFDFVGQALQEVADPLFFRVAMHPGRAVAAARRGDQLVLSLSGNPSAAFASWTALASPWWAAVQQGRLLDQRGRYPLLQAYPKATRETRLLRVLRTPQGLDATLSHSVDVLSDPWNSGYALIPQGSPALGQGTMLTYWQPAGLGGTAPRWQGTASHAFAFDPPAEFREARDR